MKKYAKTPTILQMEATECGAASLAMILAYHGRYIPLEKMRIETAVSRDGVNAADIVRAGTRFGMECHGYRREPEDLRQIPMPCILHWNFNHFVVLEGFKGKHAYLNDPAVGRRKITAEELDESFTGVVISLQKTNSFVKEKKQNRIMSFIRKRLKGQLGVIFKLIYIGLLLVIPGLILPVLSQVFIDDVLTAGYKDWLVRLLVFMGSCLLVKEGLSLYRSFILTKLQSKLTLLSGYKFLTHMFGLPIAFFDQRYAGDLVDRMSNNESINEFVSGNLAETILNIMTAIFYLAILVFYSPVLTAIGLFGIMTSLLVTVFANKVVANASMKLQMTAGKLYGAICVGLSITDTIKASGIEQEYSNRLIGHQALNSTEDQKLKRFQNIVGSIPSITNNLCDVLMLITGAILVIRGQFTTGMLVGFTALFDSFSEPINQLISFFSGLQTMKSNINRVDDIERYPQDSTDPNGIAKEMEGRKLSGRVELKDISFGYVAQKPPTVSDFSVKLHSGESVAFVGASGCGKSTIAKVVSGLYRPWSGEILMDGVPLTQIPPSVLHTSVAIVSQNIMLFSGTIRDNISMWNQTIPQEDIIAAAKDACIHDFIIQQPGGYDYVLNENAGNLSGGQRQRLEIARALAVNPTILIMDEATSALDPIVEKNIMNNLKQRGCTLIIIAHRLSTIRDCNQIIVLSKGKIIQRGTHQTLKDEDGFYKRFIQDT